MPGRTCTNCGSRQVRVHETDASRQGNSSSLSIFIAGLLTGIITGMFMSIGALGIAVVLSWALSASGKQPTFAFGMILGSIIGTILNLVLIRASI